jgi:hypothetical protein
VSAVDAPPGIAFAGVAAGELAARPGPRRLARVVLVYVLAVGALALALARRRWYLPGIELLLVAPPSCMSVAVVGWAVRSARLRIDADGVRWGWDGLGFRMTRERLASVRIYDDTVALRPRRGSTWYLARRDWDGFDRVAPALRRAGLKTERRPGRAPLAARLQSYGLVLDLLELGAAAAVTLLALLASTL